MAHLKYKVWLMLYLSHLWFDSSWKELLYPSWLKEIILTIYNNLIRKILISVYVIPLPQCFCSQSVQVCWDELILGKCDSTPPILNKTLIMITNLAFTFLFCVSVDVEFCGYTITHPSESKINFRIQTRGERHPLNPRHFIFLLLYNPGFMCEYVRREWGFSGCVAE